MQVSSRMATLIGVMIIMLTPMLILGIVAGLFLYEMNEMDRTFVKDAYYETRELAIADGAILRGWLPDFLPASTVRIRERHVIDQGRVWAKFEFDEQDIKTLLESSLEVPSALVTCPSNPNVRSAPHIDWWPGDLVNKPGPPSPNLTYYKVSTPSEVNMVTFLAVDAAKRTAWYWSTWPR